MKIDSPGADLLAGSFAREVFRAAGFATDPRARGVLALGFAGDAGSSSIGSGLLVSSDGDVGGVLPDGRFFFSGMPSKSSHQLADRINPR